jgi:tRNA (guanine26-N2/guanine27-N2)-dimethyltransferase
MMEESGAVEMSEGRVNFTSYHSDIATQDMPVFYNPRMRENRELSILLILYLLSSASLKRRLAFPMTASGIRELRLLHEHSDFFSKYPVESKIEMLVNDISAESLSIAKKNIERAGNRNVTIKYTRQDARSFLIDNRHFDYVEIDPFGTPVPFIDSAIQSLKDKSIIGVTATDTSALTGTYPKATMRKYGSKIVLSPSMHEISVRIMAAFVIGRAASHGMGMKVLLSYADEHYVKVFFEARKGKGRADTSLGMTGCIMICSKCGMFHEGIRECTLCNSSLDEVGPLYIGKLWDEKVLEFMNTRMDEKGAEEFSATLRKKMALINEEAAALAEKNIIFDMHKASSALKLSAVPKMDYIRKRAEENNKAFSRTIFSDTMIRTGMDTEETRKLLLGLHDDNDERA